MTDVEFVARAVATSRTGTADRWRECRADALLVIEACRIGAAAGRNRTAPGRVECSQATE